MPIILPATSGSGSSLALLRDYVRDELGPILGAVDYISNDDIDRYLNDGLQRIPWHREMTADLTWATDDREIALPSDFIAEDRLIAETGVRIPQHEIWGGYIHVMDPLGATHDGSARLFYFASWPTLTSEQGSLLPAPGNVALVAFACYRAYKRIASTRAEYQRYSTIMQANGVEIQDLASLSDQYYAEFLEAIEGLPMRPAATHYGD